MDYLDAVRAMSKGAHVTRSGSMEDAGAYCAYDPETDRFCLVTITGERFKMEADLGDVFAEDWKVCS